MVNYSTIFFDWSGVISDDSGDGFIKQMLLNAGATSYQAKEITETFFIDFLKGFLSEAEFWDKLKTNYGLKIIGQSSDELKKWLGLIPNKNILELVNKAKRQGLRVVVLTNIIKPVYDIIQKAGYYNLFDDAIASCVVGLAKPQREIYELALKRINVSPQESIFIDDKIVNIETANSIGFKTILAQNPTQIINDLEKLI
jgi:epoxide hydrolase-like predicted phosphatase